MEDGIKIGGTEVKYDWIALAAVLFMGFLILQAAQLHNFWPDEGRESYDALWLSQNNFNILDMPYGTHPPLMMIVEGIFFAIFGASDFTARMVVPFFATLLMFLIYKIGARLINKPAGIAAAILFFSSYLPFFMSTRVLTEVPIAFLYSLTFYLFYLGIENPESRLKLWKWQLPYMHLAGVSLGLSLLMKETAFLLFPATFAYATISTRGLNWLKRKEVWVALAIAMIVFSPWAYRNYLKLGDPTGVIRHSWVGEGIGQHVPEYNPNYFYYLSAVPSVLGPITTLLFLLSAITLVSNLKDKRAVFLLCWLLVFPALISFSNMKEPRYILPIFPAIFLLIAYLPEGLRKSVSAKQSLAILVAVALTLAFLQYPSNMEVVRQKGQGYFGLKETGEYLLANIPKEEKIMSMSMATLSFYAQRPIVMPPNDEASFLELLPEFSYIQIDSSEQTPAYLLPYLSNNPDKFELFQVFAVNTGHPLDQCPFYRIDNQCLYGSLLLRVNQTI